jgi:all-trans-retinol 13,14-reductase
VPESLDAIVIGSGIGGLTTAVLMAKSGKKVLVLEQHDQAGGCCHTFIDKGYEFDVGIHYIGEVGPGRLNKTLVDQITDGQVEWARLEHQHDIVTIGYGDKRKDYPIVSGKEEWRSLLLKQFPAEKDAIDTYLSMVEHSKSFDVIHGAMKLIPLWLAWIVVKLGLLNLFSPLWSGLYKRSTMDVVKTLTSNKDLQTIFTYCWGDFGTSPKNSHFAMQVRIFDSR